MTILRKLSYTALLIVLYANTVTGQTNCLKERLVGKWTRTSIYFTDQDTLTKQRLDILLSDSTKDKNWSWIFNNEGKRTLFPNGRRIDTYRVDEKGCRIIYGKRKKPSREQISYILYLDDNYLVLRIPNPHDHTNACFRKK